MTTAPFTRIYRPGRFEAYTGTMYDVFVKVIWTGERLSITGVEGPKRNGDCLGGCGQIHPLKLDELDWSPYDVQRLNDIWERWHLNDMRAGSPAQMEWLREHKSEWPGYPVDYYTWAKEGLAAVGLQPDPELNYSYGSQWCTEEVPDEVLADLLAFPATTKTPAWV